MKGLPFIPEMAIAAIEGRKTQTRRIMKPQPTIHPSPPCNPDYNVSALDYVWRLGGPVPGRFIAQYCEYKVGERRCLLTTWAVDKRLDYLKPTSLGDSACIDQSFGIESHFWHAGLGVAKPPQAGKSRPGRFLPNDMRRLMPVFKIVSVRAEQIQDISPADCRAEGMPEKNTDIGVRYGFGQLWNRINEKRGYGWAINPWVWVVTFRKV